MLCSSCLHNGQHGEGVLCGTWVGAAHSISKGIAADGGTGCIHIILSNRIHHTLMPQPKVEKALVAVPLGQQDSPQQLCTLADCNGEVGVGATALGVQQLLGNLLSLVIVVHVQIERGNAHQGAGNIRVVVAVQQPLGLQLLEQVLQRLGPVPLAMLIHFRYRSNHLQQVGVYLSLIIRKCWKLPNLFHLRHVLLQRLVPGAGAASQPCFGVERQYGGGKIHIWTQLGADGGRL
mmetsp:Transcript_5878/g.9043  ORF Transcript_5878/g.9043 Transcript_5878/m.9043 type:complete len:234 (+) Transcript_5878:58-759(+)